MSSQMSLQEMTVGDKGYIGSTQIVAPFKKGIHYYNNPWHQQFNKMHSNVRITVEHTIGRLKNFLCLRVPWRHDLHIHLLAFHSICQITQLGLILHPVRHTRSPHLQ